MAILTVDFVSVQAHVTKGDSLLSSFIGVSSIIELQHVISNNVVYVTSIGSDQPAHRGSLIRAFASCLYIL